MKLITIDGKEWTKPNLKQALSEKIENEYGSGAYNYPDYVGSKLYHNSTSSDIYSLNFTIHDSVLNEFKESLKKIADPNNLITHPTYGKLEHIVIELDKYGAIQGNIIGKVQYNTTKGGDLAVSFTFQEHTSETPLAQRDLETENEAAFSEIDTETSDFDVYLSTNDKSKLSGFATDLQNLYTDIQNSDVVSAFNDLNSELTKITLDSQRIINAFKNILSLPNRIFTDTKTRLNLLKQQSDSIKLITISSANMALFTTKTIAYNVGLGSRSVFVSESAQQAAAGIRTVPLT